MRQILFILFILFIRRAVEVGCRIRNGFCRWRLCSANPTILFGSVIRPIREREWLLLRIEGLELHDLIDVGAEIVSQFQQWSIGAAGEQNGEKLKNHEQAQNDLGHAVGNHEEHHV